MSTSPTSPVSTASNSTAPRLLPDLPASIVILCIYFTSALLFILRIRQSKFKFRIGALLIGLCMSRVVTFALRAAWSNNSTNKNLAIAASVFLNAGVILLIIVNMQLLIRLCKSLRPELQLSQRFINSTTAMQFFLIPILIMTIAPAIQKILTRDPDIIARDNIVLRISSTYIAIYASLPFFLAPILLCTLPRSPRSIAIGLPIKVLLIAFVSLLVGLEQSLRCANNFNPVLVGRWYNKRASFYLLTPMLELLSIIPLIAIDLPHSFGDSNAAVLKAVLSVDDKGDASETEKGQEAVRSALQATTRNWRSGVWTIIE